MTKTRILPLFGEGGGGGQGIQGPAGPQGIQGTDGAATMQGYQGIQGFAGIDGTNGIQGIQGFIGIQGADGANGLQGADGAQGIQGITGSDGIQGATGADGLQGADGAQGIQGIAGTDAVGIQGIQGPAGGGSSSNAWYGTQAEFNALQHPDQDTDYFISEIRFDEIKGVPAFATQSDIDTAKDEVLGEVHEDFEHLHGEYMSMQQFQAITPKENYNYFIEGSTIEMVVTFTDETTATYNVVVD